MNCTGFIEDGYDVSAWVDGERNLYPRVEFTYRPALRIETLRHLQQMERMLGSGNVEDSQKLSADFTATHILQWDIKRANGNLVEVTPENVRRLAPKLFARLYGVAMGTEAPDGLIDGVAGQEQWESESLKNSNRA